MYNRTSYKGYSKDMLRSQSTRGSDILSIINIVGIKTITLSWPIKRGVRNCANSKSPTCVFL